MTPGTSPVTIILNSKCLFSKKMLVFISYVVFVRKIRSNINVFISKSYCIEKIIIIYIKKLLHSKNNHDYHKKLVNQKNQINKSAFQHSRTISNKGLIIDN